jgi:hypothetical protein
VTRTAQVDELESFTPKWFLGEVVTLSTASGLLVSIHLLSKRYDDSLDAFKNAFTWVSRYDEKNGETIVDINNPCNAAFVSQQDQQQTIATAGLALTVKVNGK